MNLRFPTTLAVSHNYHTIYINATKENTETKEELFIHENPFFDHKEDAVNTESICKENILKTGIDFNSETEYKTIKMEDSTEYNHGIDLIEDCDANYDKLDYQDQINDYTCNVCFKTFQLKNRFDKHVRIHSEGKSYACAHCDKIYTKKRNLTVHNRTHMKQKPYVSKLCKKNFTNKFNLSAHSKYHREKSFNCDYCNKRYKDITTFNKHMIKHKRSKERPYSCNECDKKFTDKGHLKEHARVHSGVRPYACKICPKRFYKKGHLNEHMILHSGEKPHGCGDCGRKFAHKSNLTVHLKLHSKEQVVFDCSKCEKKFTQRASLRRHLKTHGDAFGLLSENIVATKVCWKTLGFLVYIARFF